MKSMIFLIFFLTITQCLYMVTATKTIYHFDRLKNFEDWNKDEKTFISVVIFAIIIIGLILPRFLIAMLLFLIYVLFVSLVKSKAMLTIDEEARIIHLVSLSVGY